MVISVFDIAGKAVTVADGNAVRIEVQTALKNNGTVVLSFAGIPFVTSSFLNSSLLELADQLGEVRFKASVKVRGANSQVAETIRRRIQMHFNDYTVAS